MIASAVSAIGAASAAASPGTQLDPTFGDSGVVVVTAGAEATSVAVQPNGAILVGGSVVAGASAANAGTSGVVTRLRPDGSLDPSFGENGSVPLPNLSPVIQVVGLADGSALALGGLLVRITPDGAGDPGFGQDGRALFPSSFVPARFAA